ncbi:MAG: hypothetical protein JWP44_73 [Mucilaginibacter sp.]|nr:hypothetical protein [Mucilaginibacter sp.]
MNLSGMTSRLLNDEDYYNQVVYQSKQLISLFDKEIIKNKFTALYKHLLDSYPEAGPSVREVSYPPKKRFEYDLTPISNHYNTVEVQQIRRQG